MTDSDAFRQLQARITEMERRHEEELRKLKANHNKLKASTRCPQGDKHSAHTINERT